MMRKRTHHTETVSINKPTNYVSALDRQEPIQLAPRHEVSHIIDVPMNATQHIEMKTSAVDRSLGFLLASVPLYLAFALGVVLLTVLFTSTPFFSFWSLAIFWLSFVLAWLWGYRETLMKSAEGIAYMEAMRKWDVIEHEQEKRWEHYDRTWKGED